MWKRIQHWWDLLRLRWQGGDSESESLSFGRAIAGARRILICLPWKYSEFRVARYVMKFFPEESQGRQVTYLIRQDFTQALPLRTDDEVIPVEEAQRDEIGKFSPEIEQQVFSRDFDAVVDMNTELDLGMATLVQKSGAPLRIGFSGKYSHLFYNVEIQKPGRNFILEGAYRDIQRLLLLDS